MLLAYLHGVRLKHSFILSSFGQVRSFVVNLSYPPVVNSSYPPVVRLDHSFIVTSKGQVRSFIYLMMFVDFDVLQCVTFGVCHGTAKKRCKHKHHKRQMSLATNVISDKHGIFLILKFDFVCQTIPLTILFFTTKLAFGEE